MSLSECVPCALWSQWLIRSLFRLRLKTVRQQLEALWFHSIRYGRETSFFMLIFLIGLAYGGACNVLPPPLPRL
jgi:hypothetical protein